MPCLNEERSLAFCIEEANARIRELGISAEILIADNGSTDRSCEIAVACGARVITVSEKGYGAALRGGISEANAAEFLAQPNVLCVGGSWMVPKDWLAAGDWTKVRESAAKAAAIIAAARS